MQMTLHPATIEWLTLVGGEMLSGTANVDFNLDDLQAVMPSIMCRWEALMPKVLCPVELSQRQLGLQVQSGKVLATNVHLGRTRSLSDTLTSLAAIQESRLHSTAAFPSQTDDADITPTLLHVAKQVQCLNRLI